MKSPRSTDTTAPSDCTLYLRYSTAWCSESKNLDGMLHLLMERLNDQKL